MQIKSLELLVHELTKLPGIGEKTAQRLAFFILKQGSGYSSKLRYALEEVENKVHLCSVCHAYTDNAEVCFICQSPDRDLHSLCVVEKPLDIMKVENANVFRGRYHVLHGAISPLEGIHPEDLKIAELVARVKSSKSDGDTEIREIILALDADLEGDSTALYLQKILSGTGVRLTRLAHGVPFGSDIDYIDRRTLGRALENRVEL
jgi:recombination protein RecR